MLLCLAVPAELRGDTRPLEATLTAGEWVVTFLLG
jgi:hypothetical protein